MKIAVIGSNGQLGTDLCLNNSDNEIVPLTHSDIEIKDEKKCYDVLNSIKPEVVINTAAFHNVPLCEKEREEAMRVNAIAPLNLSLACNKINAELIHYSTDYVFDGEKRAPYLEGDLPNPLNFYGISKLAGEHSVKAYCNKYKIIRVSGIYGKVPSRAKGANFVTSMLKLAKEKKELRIVNDEILAPTNTKDIARQTFILINHQAQNGIFHISNAGQCSWYEFAKTIFEVLNINVKVIPISSSELPSGVNRPSWSVLENQKLKNLSIYKMQDWKQALTEHLKKNY